jgi:hypothetical protein
MFLDYFALVVLLLLASSAVAIAVFLAMLPGRIARDRGHPHADAIRVCGWWGVLTLGLLYPLAFIWAYTSPRQSVSDKPAQTGFEEGDGT